MTIFILLYLIIRLNGDEIIRNVNVNHLSNVYNKLFIWISQLYGMFKHHRNSVILVKNFYQFNPSSDWF